MIRRIVVLLFAVLLTISCSEDEVVPRTNPRFSVAFVQTVDPTGVEFAANMYDYGSEEILEHGFVFGSGGPLSVETSEIVRASGSPGSEFRLKAIQGMRAGERMIVAAFAKTESGVVYSQPYSFVSQGSIGFVLTQITAPSEIYFGEVLTFEGENFPRNLTSIQVFFEGVEAEVSGIEGNQFKAKIPASFVFDEQRATEGRFNIRLKVGVKELEIEKVLNFRKAAFNLQDKPEIDYSGLIQIRGSDLRDIQPKAIYTDQDGKTKDLEVVNASDELIEIRPNALFTEGNPKIKLKIRGLEYEVADAFSLKPTKITAAQSDEFDGWYRFLEIQGENFNPLSPEFNRLILSGSSYHNVEISEATSTRLKVTLVPNEGLYSRNISIHAEMGPGKSQNAYALTVNTPQLPVLELSYEQYAQFSGVGVSYLGKGYTISENGIYEFSNPEVPPKKLYGQIQVPYFTFSKMAFVTGGEGKLFLSDGEIVFSFNLASKQIKSHPDLPNIAAENLGFFVEGGYLYAEYGNLSGWGFNPSCKRRFRLNLASDVWEELEPESRNRYYISNKPFRVNGELYSYRIVTEESTNSSEIVHFNSLTKNWDLVKKLSSNYIQISTNEVYVVGDLIYFPADTNSFVLDSKNWEAKSIDNFYFGMNHVNGFQIGSNFYQFNYWNEKIVLYEVDPSYFTFQ